MDDFVGMLPFFLPQFETRATKKEKINEMLRAKHCGLEGKPATEKQLFQLQEEMHYKYRAA